MTTRRLPNTLPLLPLLLLGATAAEASAQETFSSRCGAGVHVDERTGWVWFPEGQIFCPLMADPKEERGFSIAR